MAKGLYTKYLTEPTLYSPKRTYGDAISGKIDPRSIPRNNRPPAHTPIYVAPADPDYVLVSYYGYGYSLIDAPDYDYTPLPLLLYPLNGYVLDDYIKRPF